MRHRNSSELGRGDRGTDAGHHLERDAGHRERERFLGAAAEHERIAALEAYHALALASGADHQPVDRILPDALAPRALADAEALRPGESPQRMRIDERVEQYQVRLLEIRDALLRPQVRITRPGTHQRYLRSWGLGLGIRDLGFARVERIQHREQLGTP